MVFAVYRCQGKLVPNALSVRTYGDDVTIKFSQLDGFTNFKGMDAPLARELR